RASWRAAWDRLLLVRPRSRMAIAALSTVLALACGTTALIGYDLANADDAIAGKEVDAVTAQTIMLAALSCPALTGPDLAGQLMANSGQIRAGQRRTGQCGKHDRLSGDGVD